MNDGVVGRAEIERVYLAAVDCLVRAGLHGSVTYDLDLSTALSSDLFLTGAQGESGEVARRRDQCVDPVLPVAAVYESTLPADIEFVQAQRFLACLESAYPDVAGFFPSNLPYGELERLVVTSGPLAAPGVDAVPLVECVQRSKGVTVNLPGR